MDYDPPLTPQQRRLLGQLKGKSQSPFAGSPWWIDEADYDEVGYGKVRVNLDSPGKVKLMATRKFVASFVVEANITDKYDQSIKVGLLSVNLTSDDLTDLLSKAHGHLELVSDK